MRDAAVACGLLFAGICCSSHMQERSIRTQKKPKEEDEDRKKEDEFRVDR
jgi:hypothetical protein